MTSRHIHIFLSPYWLLFFLSFLPTLSITHTQECGNYYLLLITKMRAKEKTYVRVSVWWKTKSESWGIYTSHIHWVTRGTGTPNDKDEVNKREVCECDGWVCDLEVIGAPLMFNVIRSTAVLTRMLVTLDFSCEENAVRGSGTGQGQITQTEVLNLQKSGQFPDESVRKKGDQFTV